MKMEYQILAGTTLFYLFAWLPASVAKWQFYGPKWLASNRDTTPKRELPAWGARSERAYQNLKDYYLAFVVVVFLLGQYEKFNNITLYLCLMYALSRVGHFVSYIAGSFNFRFLFFVLSMIANLALWTMIWL